MKIHDWDKLRIFYHVAVAGSFTQGAQKLCLSQSAVSRQILALESSLHSTLFHRHAQGLVLTEVGKILFQTAQDMFLKCQETEIQLEADLVQPRGPLRISAPSYFSEKWLAPRLGRFQSQYPQVSLMLEVQDTYADLENGQCDVAIRPWASGLSDLIQQKFMTYVVGAYASQEYLAAQGRPQSPADLKSHRFFLFEGDPKGAHHFRDDPSWQGVLSELDPKTILFKSNSYGLLEYLIRQGGGIGFLPTYGVAGEGQPLPSQQKFPGLECLFPLAAMEKIHLCVVYSPALKGSKKIHVFKEFLMEESKENQPLP